MTMRITNKKKFKDQIRKFADMSGVRTSLVAKKLAFEAFSKVVEFTPVDTGWARASWNITEGSIDPSVPPKPAKGTTLPDPEPNVTLTSNFPKFYITNNLPYIIYLEDPADNVQFRQPDKGHMVKRTLNILDIQLDRAIKELK